MVLLLQFLRRLQRHPHHFQHQMHNQQQDHVVQCQRRHFLHNRCTTSLPMRPRISSASKSRFWTGWGKRAPSTAEGALLVLGQLHSVLKGLRHLLHLLTFRVGRPIAFKSAPSAWKSRKWDHIFKGQYKHSYRRSCKSICIPSLTMRCICNWWSWDGANILIYDEFVEIVIWIAHFSGWK